MLTSRQQRKKRQKLRHNEYYDFQNILDNLYQRSSDGKVFKNLLEIITSPSNIKLAYRNIKRNDGSHTAGVDGRNITNISEMTENKYVSLIQRKLSWYKPNAVKRKEIPKPNGKMRPLGIPTIIDRLVQQCILQVLEPICEAKFYEHSYGFRPNRSTENAIARCYSLIQRTKLYYVVDIDIMGFFDNVNHCKLIKQMWELGIQDKKLLCIIKAMLKAPIKMPDGSIMHPMKGTPQGGILSPLLSNIVLNELDWWIASQWEHFPTAHQYYTGKNKNGSDIKSHTYRALKTTNLKEIYIVRYADDFKIFCRHLEDANKIFLATKQWLAERLKLDISLDKSKVVNLKQDYSEFLGLKLRAVAKGDKYTVKSHICDKARRRIINEAQKRLKAMQNPKNGLDLYFRVQNYNSAVIGWHNYYSIATHASIDFSLIAYGIKKRMKSRLPLKKLGEIKQPYIQKRYGKSKQLRFIEGHPIIPLGFVQFRKPMHKSKCVNQYTPDGRAAIHQPLAFDISILLWMMSNPVQSKTIEYADNRISLYAAQYGKCAVTGFLLSIDTMHCHHIIPTQFGGTDKYQNLVLIDERVHILIHATKQETISNYLKMLNLNSKQLEKLNKFRVKANLPAID